MANHTNTKDHGLEKNHGTTKSATHHEQAKKQAHAGNEKDHAGKSSDHKNDKNDKNGSKGW